MLGPGAGSLSWHLEGTLPRVGWLFWQVRPLAVRLWPHRLERDLEHTPSVLPAARCRDKETKSTLGLVLCLSVENWTGS